MSLWTHQYDQEIKINFNYLPCYKKPNKNVSILAYRKFLNIRKSYDFLVELSTPKKCYLVNYMAIALGLDTPIVEAITWSISNTTGQNRRNDIYSEMLIANKNLVLKYPQHLEILPDNKPIIGCLMDNNTNLNKFCLLNIDSLTNREIREWYMKTTWYYFDLGDINGQSILWHMKHLQDREDTLKFRGITRKRHEAIIIHLKQLQSQYKYLETPIYI